MTPKSYRSQENSLARITQLAVLAGLGIYGAFLVSNSMSAIRSNMMLDKYGIMSRALVVEKAGGTSAIDTRRLVYLFKVENETITGEFAVGESLWTEATIGDSIDIVYLQSVPKHNRPLGSMVFRTTNVSGLIAGLALLLIAALTITGLYYRPMHNKLGMFFRGSYRRRYISQLARLKTMGIDVPSEKLEARFIECGEINDVVDRLISMKEQGETPDIDAALTRGARDS